MNISLLATMRGAAWGILFLFFHVLSGQYVDTVEGKITVFYNNPSRFHYSLFVGSGFETQSMEGSVILPNIYAEAHVKPVNWMVLHGYANQQLQLGWQFQKIRDTRNFEVGLRLYPFKKRMEKWRTFTTGNKVWNYDFHFPVQADWQFGLTGSYRFGSGVFNSGLDETTAIRFENRKTGKTEFLENAAVPYTFSEYTAGFSLSTSSFMKLRAHLPTQVSKFRRIHTFTEFRVEAIFRGIQNYDTLIHRLPFSDAPAYIPYGVRISKRENWGFRVAGFFRRRLVGMKVECGVRPGIQYRFSSAEKASIMDRSFLLLGVGIGWM
ncbi:MAG: hypothetical protein JNL57_08445 [Bacteroidetes bacterium]|nr:hypothetical protein [Bacteroidota bacterium]